MSKLLLFLLYIPFSFFAAFFIMLMAGFSTDSPTHDPSAPYWTMGIGFSLLIIIGVALFQYALDNE